MIKKLAVFVFCIGFSAISAVAQDSRLTSAAGDKYLISAKAGGVNLVEGTVGVVRKAGGSGLLVKGDELEVGDRVSTSTDARAEILLNPGSYMRLAGDTAVELKTTSLDDLRIRLDRGSAMFEVFATKDFAVSIVAPKAQFAIIESGIYRVDVGTDGAAQIEVWDGRVLLLDSARTFVRSGLSATLSGSTSSTVKLKRDEKNPFVAWSKARGKELAKASASMKNKGMRNSLISSFNGGRWGLYSSFGLWVRDAASGRACFLPFGSDWYSPYGFWYGNSIRWYNLPPVIYQQPVPDMYGVKVRARGEGSATERDERPPFVRIQNDEGARGRSPVRPELDLPLERPSYAPTYIPAAPTYSPPAEPGAKTRP